MIESGKSQPEDLPLKIALLDLWWMYSLCSLWEENCFFSFLHRLSTECVTVMVFHSRIRLRRECGAAAENIPYCWRGVVFHILYSRRQTHKDERYSWIVFCSISFSCGCRNWYLCFLFWHQNLMFTIDARYHAPLLLEISQASTNSVISPPTYTKHLTNASPPSLIFFSLCALCHSYSHFFFPISPLQFLPLLPLHITLPL